MTAGQGVLWVLALIALGFCLRRGPGVVRRVGAETGQSLIKILPMFAKYNITTFCAPPTMYRMLIKQDLSRFDLSSIQHATTAGEALNPEVYYQFEKATGLQIAEGFGQTRRFAYNTSVEGQQENRRVNVIINYPK